MQLVLSQESLKLDEIIEKFTKEKMKKNEKRFLNSMKELKTIKSIKSKNKSKNEQIRSPQKKNKKI